MHKFYLSAGAILGAMAVALGAFGAHSLKKIILTGILFERFSNTWVKRAGICFITGIVLFSGSLYLLTALRATDKMGLDGIGIITPFGGLFFILGWLLLFAGIIKKQ